MMKKFLAGLLALAAGMMVVLAVWADELPEGVEIQHPKGMAPAAENPMPIADTEEAPEEEETEELPPEPQPQITRATAPQTGDGGSRLIFSSMALSLLALGWAKKLKTQQE